MSKHIVVIGAGVAGMEAAGRLAKSGFDVTVLEKESTSGGHLNDWYKLFPDRRDSSEVKEYLENLASSERINSGFEFVLTDAAMFFIPAVSVLPVISFPFSSKRKARIPVDFSRRLIKFLSPGRPSRSKMPTASCP